MSSCASGVVQPDPVLLAPCERPGLIGNTWGDLAEAYILRGEAIDECNARLDLLREVGK